MNLSCCLDEIKLLLGNDWLDLARCLVSVAVQSWTHCAFPIVLIGFLITGCTECQALRKKRYVLIP